MKLTWEDVHAIKDHNYIVGNGVARNGTMKVLTYNPFSQEFTIFNNHMEYQRTIHQEEALSIYNGM